MRKISLILALVLVLGLALFLVSGCGKEEMQKIKSEKEALLSENETLKKENETLKGQIASLEQEVSKLKETAQFHYQQGVDLLKESKYEEAKAKFDTVIEKYPESPFVSSAKENLKKISREIKRVETEKLTAEENSPADAEATWDMLRKNPKEKEGKVFTLELRADFVSQGECIIESRVAAAKVFAITCLYTKMDTQSFRNFESIKREDWFMIKGRFVGINSGGQVVIIADKCKNLGYR